MKNQSATAWCVLSSVFGLLSAGCEEEFEPGSRVSSLRVLAVQVDQPYARPGETVRFDALAVEPLGRDVTWAWATCLNPSSSTVQGCLDRVGEDVASGNTSGFSIGADMSSFEFTVPSSILEPVAPAARPTALFGAVSVACPGDLSLGGSATTPFVCRDPGSGRELGLDEFVVGVKRVGLREADRNQNPVIERVTFDGDSWAPEDVKEVGSCNTDGNDYADCKGSDRHQIAAVVSAASAEAGTDEFGASFEEELVVQYYATEGIFDEEVRIGSDPETGWVARGSASGRELTLWFVARDDRGGVSWAERRVRVR